MCRAAERVQTSLAVWQIRRADTNVTFSLMAENNTSTSVTDWGNDHVGSYRAGPTAYSELVNDFLDDVVAGWPPA